jgi:hypothetical protein
MVRDFAKVTIFISFFQRYRDMNHIDHIDSCPVTVATYKVLIIRIIESLLADTQNIFLHL